MENKLAAFIVELATSPAKLTRYQSDEEAAMAEAGLSEQQQNVLRSGNWRAICEFLGDDVARPMTASSPDDGGDTGGGT